MRKMERIVSSIGHHGGPNAMVAYFLAMLGDLLGRNGEASRHTGDERNAGRLPLAGIAQRNLERTKRFTVVGGNSVFSDIAGAISCSSIPQRLQKMRLLESAFRTGT